ncbi:hypothetical protein CORC01_14441 [Colletotrichum orchidophilum]|uniref:Uncharacterized protein n=1 Tax=Colletotrichum orchidophilum TaxID=1209926 RepID=A0A1G4AM65_9PEZI|nr:uncharacterized protein CORC01_14441 [Colletotrichum orchidophilum]OHE90264.1 hypothetical protein CORC01_14441 [Colletotrichum orchidophilum]
MSDEQRISMVACIQCTEIRVDQEAVQLLNLRNGLKIGGEIGREIGVQGNSVHSVNQDRTVGSASSEACEQHLLPCNRSKSGKTPRYQNSKVVGTEYI